MDFEVISFRERSYKVISTLAVVIISVALVVWCYSSKFEASVVFFASALYALFLFLISLFINNTVTIINDHITERAETYNRLTSVLSKMEWMGPEDDPVTRIETFKGITGRREEDLFRREHNGDKTYFEVWGKFKMPLSKETEKKIGELEQKYLEKNSEICKRIGDIILQFEDIIKSENQTEDDFDEDYDELPEEADEEETDEEYDPRERLRIKKAISFSIEEWSKFNHFSDYDKDALADFYSSHKDLPQIIEETKTLKESFSDIEKLYSECKRKVEENIKQIQGVYGKRIDYEAQRLYELSDSMGGLTQEMDDAKQEIIDSVSEVFDLLSDVESRVSEFESSVEDITLTYEKIEEKINMIQTKIKDLNSVKE